MIEVVELHWEENMRLECLHMAKDLSAHENIECFSTVMGRAKTMRDAVKRRNQLRNKR